jgi:uroporphyrinogen-III synthase
LKPRVLITREPERAADLILQLSESGIYGIAEPVTRTVFLTQSEPLPDLTRFDWIAFTSVHGVEGFADILAASKRPLPIDLKIAVVGSTTAGVANCRFRVPDLVAPAADAQSLASALTERCAESYPEYGEGKERRSPSVFWPCATKTTERFAERLNEAHIRLVPWPVYATEAVEPAELHERLEELWPWKAAVFAAPSAVRAFRNAWPLPWKFEAVAIGPTTAGALQKSGVTSVHVSDTPAAVGLTHTILDALQQEHHA